MKKVAIISFFHTEMSLCLSQYMVKHDVQVDYYNIRDLIRDKGFTSGFEYKNAKKNFGIVHLSKDDIPEIYKEMEGLPINFYLIRLFSFSDKLLFINKIIIKNVTSNIRKRHYDAINIIGQHPWVELIHNNLIGENIIHTFHEIGSHQDGIPTTSLLNKVIKDKSKVIVLSNSTLERFLSIPGSKNIESAMIPMGKFETLLLYEKDYKLDVNIDSSKTTFLFYGFIRPYKGLGLLKEAIRLLEDIEDKYNLIIAGGGHDENLRFFQCCPNCYVLNHFLANDEMLKLNRISDTIVLPYKSASQSGIVFTSFLLGKPIISTKVGAFTETITNGHNGILVEPNDAKGFANAMRLLINDKGMLKKMSEGAKAFGNKDEYDWNNIVEKTLKFYWK